MGRLLRSGRRTKDLDPEMILGIALLGIATVALPKRG
jgi:hypothetical protein